MKHGCSSRARWKPIRVGGPLDHELLERAEHPPARASRSVSWTISLAIIGS